MINMQEQEGDLWRFHEQGEWVAVTTNGQRKSNDEAVMGAGVALQAARRHPKLPRRLGKQLKTYGNRLFVFRDLRVMTFPTKDHWKHSSDPKLIQTSAWQLMVALGKFEIDQIYIPRPGCGLGNLDWSDVRQLLMPLFDGRVIVLSQPELIEETTGERAVPERATDQTDN